MKNFNTKKLIPFTIIFGLLIAIGCTKDEFGKSTNDFRIKAKYQKKITVTDETGENSLVLGISSDNLEAFNSRTDEIFSINPLTSEELEVLEQNKSSLSPEEFEYDQTFEDTITYNVHLEILSKKMGDNIVALNLKTAFPESTTLTSRASGTKYGCTYHYSWEAPHIFYFSGGDTSNFDFKKVSATFELVYEGKSDWLFWDYQYEYSPYNYSPNDDIDTRVRACPSGSFYYYTVK